MFKAVKAVAVVSALSLAAMSGFNAASAAETSAHKGQLVEFEMMTWPEVKAALAAGKTTALIYTGGVEERGPQNANGGHNLMARAIVKGVAEKLGNAIAMPVLPFTPNKANAQMPGTIGITNELLGELLERMTEQSIDNGFKIVVIMGDHGGGQPKVYDEVAKKLDEKYAPQGIHVYYCDQIYMPANSAFDEYLKSKNIPLSMHGGVPDTSLMLYLGGDTWVRKNEIANAVGSPIGPDGKPQIGPEGPKNGIIGDGRQSTAELGKKLYDIKVDYAVKQIKEFQASAAAK